MRYLFAVMIAMIVVAGCTEAPAEQHQASAEQHQIKIGGLFCQTGYASFAGESSTDGFLLAIADAEARGIDVEYEIEDCQSDFTKTATAARKLIDVDGMSVIIGPEWEFGAVVAPIAADGEALFVTPWLTTEQEWTQAQLFMSAMPREQRFTDAFADWMVAEGIESVAFVGSIDEFAETVHDTVEIAFERDSINLTDTIMTEVDGDFRTEILRLKDDPADAVFVVIATDADEARFVRQAVEIGLEKRILVHYARAESDAFLDACGDACEGVVFASPRPPTRSAEFAEKFADHYGSDPIAPSAATAYDVTTDVIEAMEAGAVTPLEVQRYLATHTFDGYAVTSWDRGYAAGGAADIKTIADGERVIIT